MSDTGAMSPEAILQSVERLPSPPSAVIEIIHTLEDSDASADVLARKVEADLGLLTSVLRLVNSAHYAISGGVSSIRQAIALLGFNAIRNLVCIHGISDYFQRGGGSFDYRHLVRHSIGVGCVARVFARSVTVNPDTAFVAAMVHDAGKFALAIAAPDEHALVLDYIQQHDCHVTGAENAVIGMDHAKIGAHLARHWNLPEEICHAVACHHQPPEDDMESSPLADLIHVADVLAHAMELGLSEQVPPLSGHAMLRLKLSLHTVARSLGKIEEEYADYAQMMNV